MATYKAEFLAHHYEGRLRPRAALRARLATGVRRCRGAAAPGRHRQRAEFDARAAAASHEGRRSRGTGRSRFSPGSHCAVVGRASPRSAGWRGTVMLWPDTFTNHFHPHVGQAAVTLLEDAGWSVCCPNARLCCGLTWISTGQLDTAKKVLRRTVAALAEHLRAGGLVVGLEPSCTAVFRSDAAELLPDDLDVQTPAITDRHAGRVADEAPPGGRRRSSPVRDAISPGALPPARGDAVGQRQRSARSLRRFG